MVKNFIFILLFFSFIFNLIGEINALTPSPPVQCDSCASCNSAISIAASGDTILLNTSISNDDGDCILFDNDYGIIFDCQNYSNFIDGDDDNTGVGIKIYNSYNNTINNCNVTQFEYGILLLNVTNSTIDSNIANGNNDDGFNFFISVTNVLLINNIGNDNAKYGLNLVSGSDKNNQIISNEFKLNSWSGIYIRGNDNFYINNSIVNNSMSGIYFENYMNFGGMGNNNTFVSNNITFNLGANIWYDGLVDDNNFTNNYLGNSSKIGTSTGNWTDFESNIFEGNYYSDFNGTLPFCFVGGDACDILASVAPVSNNVQSSSSSIFPSQNIFLTIFMIMISFIIF